MGISLGDCEAWALLRHTGNNGYMLAPTSTVPTLAIKLRREVLRAEFRVAFSVSLSSHL